MSVPPVDPAQGAAPVTVPTDPAAEPQRTFTAEYVAELRRENAKFRTEAKANADAAKKLAEIEDADKSEAQKAAEQIAALQAQLKGFETKEQIGAWKAQVSKDTGVPAEALAGTTLEELQAHAEILKPLIKAASFPGVIPSQGKTPPTPPGDKTSPKSVPEARDRAAAKYHPKTT